MKIFNFFGHKFEVKKSRSCDKEQAWIVRAIETGKIFLLSVIRSRKTYEQAARDVFLYESWRA